MKTKFKLTTLACAALTALAMAGAANARCMDCEPDPPEPAPLFPPGPRIADATPGIARFSNMAVEIKTADEAGLFTDFVNKYIFGGARDMGDWYCSYCSIVPTDVSQAATWGEFVTSTVNTQLWPGLIDPATGLNLGQWRPGDTVAVCNGSGFCVVLTWHPNSGTVGWTPDLTKPTKILKPDLGKYKNKPGQTNNNTSNQREVRPIYSDDGYVWFWLFFQGQPPEKDGTECLPHCVTSPGPEIITAGPSTPVPGDANGPPDPGNYGGGNGSFGGGSGGGGGGGESCVHVDSRLPDGRRAGDIKVGDTIQLGDEGTLDTRVGVVTYSKPSMQRGYRITTQSGISLLCSDTAPICTDDGFVKAPELLGKKVAVRVDDAHNLVTRFELVEVVAEVGMIEVQHITVGDQAFWAGAEHGSYILHHNKTIVEFD